MNRSARALLLTPVVLLAPACSVARPEGAGIVTSCVFTNPIAAGQDPWVVRHDGWYYLVESANNGITVYRSRQLTDPKQNGVVVWRAPASGWNRAHVWAPELHLLDGRWYIYYAAGSAGPPFIHQRSGVLAGSAADPQAPYTDRGLLYTGADVASGDSPLWAIDLTVFQLGSQLYAVWSGWETDASTDRTPQHLYIARMSDPTRISSNRVRISSPTESWERGTELDLQEGPELLRRGDDVFLIYSTRESWLREYRLGQLRLSGPTADPLLPGSWTKSGPVFAGTESVFGAGHASFTTSPDGSEDWIVYHSKTSDAPGWNRVIRAQKFGWHADGSPDFGSPVPTGQPLPLPAGQCGL